jgi:hypothetical protein
MKWQLASTEIAPERDLIPSGIYHAYADGVGETACGLRLGLDVRMIPDFPWEKRGRGAYGDDCPVCAGAIDE